MLPESLNDDFFEGRRSDVLPFCVNDLVEVIAGVYAGRQGFVELLDRTRDLPRFLVDLQDGTDELFGASDLSLLDAV
jgi:hypothetical protein